MRIIKTGRIPKESWILRIEGRCQRLLMLMERRRGERIRGVERRGSQSPSRI